MNWSTMMKAAQLMIASVRRRVAAGKDEHHLWDIWPTEIKASQEEQRLVLQEARRGLARGNPDPRKNIPTISVVQDYFTLRRIPLSPTTSEKARKLLRTEKKLWAGWGRPGAGLLTFTRRSPIIWKRHKDVLRTASGKAVAVNFEKRSAKKLRK